MIALALGATLSATRWSKEYFFFSGQWKTAVIALSGTVTMAHLVVVFFRSHANPDVFKKHPFQFRIMPFVLFGLMAVSSWFLVLFFVLSVWWDVYHSSLQTFGLGRLYDAKLGNDVRKGRAWDKMLNLYLYLGPVLAGVSLLDHTIHFKRFGDVGMVFFTDLPERLEAIHRPLAYGMMISGFIFLSAYLMHMRHLSRRGYAVSPQKIILYSCTGACSIYTWGFNSFGESFFIMNFFHAVQYFALVWHAEKSTIVKCFHLQRARQAFGRRFSLVLFLASALVYGFWAEMWGQTSHYGMSLVLTVSILHFWYDGFIWSARRGEVGR